MELGVYDAVAHFNLGKVTIVNVFNTLNIEAGLLPRKMCELLEEKRKYSAGYKEMTSTKRLRKIIRNMKKNKSDIIQKEEGTSYKAGSYIDEQL